MNPYNQAVTDKQRDTALEKQKALWESLDPAQQAAAKSIMAVKSAWAGLVETMKPQVFTLSATALNAIALAIPALTPMLNGVAVALDGVTRSLISSLQGPFWSTFMANISQIAGPMLGSLLRSLGNIVTGLAGMLSAFLPMVDGVTGGLEEIGRAHV